MPAEARALRLLPRLAGACAVLVLVVVAASAYLRLAQAGFSCADWPACYGQLAANQSAMALEALSFWARVMHRLAATGVTVLVLCLVVLAYRLRLAYSRLWRLSGVALALTLFLAVLGFWTSGNRYPAITLGNLLGGMALLAILWRLRTTVPDAAPSAPIPPTLLVLAAVLLALQVALGGLVSASFAGLSCPGFPGCGAVGASFDWALFNPLRRIEIDASGGVLRPAELSGLVVAHRLLALALSLAILTLAAWLWRRGASQKVLALRLVVLLGVAYGLGVASAFAAPPLYLVFGHNVVAALLAVSLAEVS